MHSLWPSLANWEGLEAGEVAAKKGGLEPVEKHHELVPRRHLPPSQTITHGHGRLKKKDNHGRAGSCRHLSSTITHSHARCSLSGTTRSRRATLA